jgi:hypothetical protein
LSLVNDNAIDDIPPAIFNFKGSSGIKMKVLKASMYFISRHLSSARKLAGAICPHGRLVTEHLDSRFMITMARHINGLSWVAEEDFIINADRVYSMVYVKESCP